MFYFGKNKLLTFSFPTKNIGRYVLYFYFLRENAQIVWWCYSFSLFLHENEIPWINLVFHEKKYEKHFGPMISSVIFFSCQTRVLLFSSSRQVESSIEVQTLLYAKNLGDNYREILQNHHHAVVMVVTILHMYFHRAWSSALIMNL